MGERGEDERGQNVSCHRSKYEVWLYSPPLPHMLLLKGQVTLIAGVNAVPYFQLLLILNLSTFNVRSNTEGN